MARHGTARVDVLSVPQSNRRARVGGWTQLVERNRLANIGNPGLRVSVRDKENARAQKHPAHRSTVIRRESTRALA